jgi:regulatory protein YycH of two-component signal transduction system YycFG
MLVIEGYAGKSLKVFEYLESLDCDKVLICDREHMNLSAFNYENIKPDVFCIRITDDYEIDTFIKNFREHMELNNEEKFHNIIFYMNTTKDNISKFKALEDEFKLNAVLTVQTPDMGGKPREVSIYSI